MSFGVIELEEQYNPLACDLFVEKEGRLVIKKSRLAALLAAPLILSLSACGNNKRFESAAWLNADARERGRMAQNLVDSNLLMGKTAHDVRRALGSPDVEYPMAFKYQINLGWLFKNPKHYGLLIYLDQNRQVREVKIVD